MKTKNIIFIAISSLLMVAINATASAEILYHALNAVPSPYGYYNVSSTEWTAARVVVGIPGVELTDVKLNMGDSPSAIGTFSLTLEAGDFSAPNGVVLDTFIGQPNP